MAALLSRALAGRAMRPSASTIRRASTLRHGAFPKVAWAAGAVAVGSAAVYSVHWWYKDSLPLGVRIHIVKARRASTPSDAVAEYELAIQRMNEHKVGDGVSVFLHDAAGNVAYDAGDYHTAVRHLSQTARGMVCL